MTPPAAHWAWLGNAAATQQRRQDLWALLGRRPEPADTPIGHRLSAERWQGGWLERWQLHLNGEQAVPALLLIPDQPPTGWVLYCHAHGNRFECGKDEVLHGRPALQTPPYGGALLAQGLAVLAIDHWGFGERRQVSERALVKRLLWQGSTLWGWRLHDTLAALAWARTEARLASLPVATLGLSMGSTMAVWAAALCPDIAACVDLCCLADYGSLLASGGFDLHGEYFFVPGLLPAFSASEISALIAPRPHLSLAGTQDPLTPPEGLRIINQAMQYSYHRLGQAAHWAQVTEACGHVETLGMRQAVLAFLGQHLGSPPRPSAGRDQNNEPCTGPC